MSGYSTIKKVRNFEKEVAELGFELCSPNNAYSSATSAYSNSWTHNIETSGDDYVILIPADDRYPIYTRGASLFTGTIEEAMKFFQGIKFAYATDSGINLSNEKKRATAEAKYVERMRKQEELRIKRAEQKKIWAILADEKEYDEVPF